MGLMDSLRRFFKPGPLRDRDADRQAGVDPKLGVPTPSGSVGPSGETMAREQGEGGAIEPDPPKDIG